MGNPWAILGSHVVELRPSSMELQKRKEMAGQNAWLQGRGRGPACGRVVGRPVGQTGGWERGDTRGRRAGLQDMVPTPLPQRKRQ